VVADQRKCVLDAVGMQEYIVVELLLKMFVAQLKLRKTTDIAFLTKEVGG
jgi:hypothetical protein